MFRRLLLVLVVWTPASGYSGNLYQAFQGGVLGIAWNTTLSGVVGTFPDGDHVFAATPGERAYWVKDGQSFLGVSRERNGVLFGLDKANHVVVAAVAYPYERSAERKSTLISMFGAPTSTSSADGRTRYGWQADSGISAAVTEFGLSDQRMIWLVVNGPGYSQPTQCQCKTR